MDGDQWNFGPEPPYYIFNGASVQLKSTFFNVGGQNAINYFDTIWTFDVDDQKWTLLEDHLTTGREITTAFLVPDDIC